jgi:hypothetical protein
MTVAARFPVTGRKIEARACPATLRRRVATLMGDGKWRSARDVAFRLHVPVSQASTALKIMDRMGLFTTEVIKDCEGEIKIYRAALEARTGDVPPIEVWRNLAASENAARILRDGRTPEACGWIAGRPLARDITDETKAVLAAFRGGSMATDEIRDRFGFDSRTASNVAQRLCAFGFLERVGRKAVPGGRGFTVWELTPSGREYLEGQA